MGEEDQPTPALPILASNLLESEEKQRRRFADKGERISSACAVLDESVLGEGGVERGIVLGISADGVEGRLLSLNLIVSVLLSNTQTSGPKSPQVAIIDTTGSFPISLLARVIRARILQAAADPTLKSATTANSTSTNYGQIDKENLLNEVQKYLEQVTISRVFDVEGLWEVLSEVTLESPSSLPQRDGKTIAADLMKRSTSSFPITLPAGEEPSIVEEIIDSEDENLTPDDNYGPTAKQPIDQGHEGIQILVVDNMGDIINELLARKEKTDAHNQLGALSTFIHNLSSYSNILTILHNSTISSNPPHSSNADARPSSRHQPQLSSITLSSIFNSNPLKPALGRIFDQFPSLHVMLSPMPKARGDAELLYGEDDDTRPKSGIEYCTILEVLKDETPNLGHGRSSSRFGARERQWVGLVVSNEGIGLRHAFGEEDEKF